MKKENYLINQRDVEICLEEMMAFTGQKTVTVEDECKVYEALIKFMELKFKVDCVIEKK